MVHSSSGRPTLEVVLTISGTSAKFDRKTYKTSVGLHGIGAKAVTALSEWVEAEVRRSGRTYFQEYERGRPITEVKDRGPDAVIQRRGCTLIVCGNDRPGLCAGRPAWRQTRQLTG